MKFKYILVSVLSSTLLLSSCMDKFADINTNPSVVGTANPIYEFTQMQETFQPTDYWAWFYDYSNMSRWGQVTVSSGGNSEDMNETDQSSGGTNSISALMNSYRDIAYHIRTKSVDNPAEAAKLKHVEAMANTLVVYIALLNTDMYGSKVYSEMSLAREGGPLVPKYDSQEEMFTEFAEELDVIVSVLSKKTYLLNGVEIAQSNPGSQDMFAAGDHLKWGKFANSLRLKLAARLYTYDQAKAIALVNKAAKESIGFIEDYKDDMINRKGIKFYGPGDLPNPGYASKPMVDFLKKNRDPRLRFLFTKNSYNSKVVQAYLDVADETGQPVKLPKYILDNIVTEVVDGKTVFKKWGGEGEPWVRYYGLPTAIAAQNEAKWDSYFDLSNFYGRLSMKDSKGNAVEKSYNLMSSLQLQHYGNRASLTYPDAPNVVVKPNTDPRRLFTYILSAGEVNLYLAEFKILGADLPKTAAEYFKLGVENSVRGWNELSRLNKIMYYDEVYDKNEETVKLKDGEIEALLTKEAYKLTGDKSLDLEKIYLQHRFNFIMLPQEMYVTMRRSGIPKFNSTIYSFEQFNSDGSEYLLPRRFAFKYPADTDMMKNNILDMMNQQGFTVGKDPVILNGQRVWYDKKAPQFGAGMNY